MSLVSPFTSESSFQIPFGSAGWSYKKGDYSLQQFTAERKDNKVIVKLTGKTGKGETENKDMAIVKVITEKGILHASGNLLEGIEVKL